MSPILPMLVRSLMSTPVISLEADHSVNLALGIMTMSHVRHLPVLAGGQLVGLVTHRDLLKAQAAQLARPTSKGVNVRDLSVRVGDIMQTEVWRVAPETPVLEAARIMLDHKFGCLPVVEHEHGSLVGIVTQIDLLARVVEALERRRDREDTNPGEG